MKLKISEPRVVVRGIRPEEGLWGPYQFQSPYRLDDRIVVSVHRGVDSIKHYGDALMWFESFDDGETWQEADPSIEQRCGVKLPNGDRIHFPRVSSIDLSDYKIPTPQYLTPGTDLSTPAEEGTLPMHDGITYWQWGTTIRAYRASRLPESLRKSEWKMIRQKSDGTASVEFAKVDWESLTRVVFSDQGFHNCQMKGLFPTGVPKIGPDGAIWITAFSGEGHINPQNGQYSPYYSAELFRSTDLGRSFQQYAHMEYPADGDRYPYLSGGFSDNEIAFFDDGSMCWFMRSAWYASTTYEWAPMYYSRSTDGGKTWTKPEVFSFTGIYPSLCRLDCGVTLICFARPGMFVSGCRNDDSEHWCEPVELMTAGDRSRLANIPQENVRFHDWDGADHNARLIPLDEKSALIFNCDFYYPDDDGVKRKTVYCQKITVEEI